MGERARSRGISGEDKAWQFLSDLGYQLQEVNNEDYNIDCLAIFPQRTHKLGLLRPRYSPEGLTAFEVTSEQLRRKKITDFEMKIAKYNEDNCTKPIKGGVIIVDQKIPLPMMKLMESKHLFGWGIQRQLLYQEKINLFEKWSSHLYVPVCEIYLDETTTYLRCSTPPKPTPPKLFEKLLHFAIFCDDHKTKLQPNVVMEILEKIRFSLVGVIEAGIVPLYIHFELHALGGVAPRMQALLETFVKKWEENYGIYMDLAVDSFKDYQTFAALTRK